MKDKNVYKWKMELMEDFLVRWFILDMNLILERIVQGQIVEAKLNFILDGTVEHDAIEIGIWKLHDC